MTTTSTNTFSYLEHLPNTPQIMIDTNNLISHFYKNSPPLKSRVLGIALKYTAQELFFKNNALTQSGNPTVTNVIREGTNIIPLSYNAYIGEKHVAGKNETLEGIYLLGQQSRFLCKAIPQYLSGGDVTYARVFNIACDSPAIMGNYLSKDSQRDPNKQIYWFWKEESNNLENIWIGDYLKTKVTYSFVTENIITAGVKAIVLDQIGDLLNIVKSSSLINVPYEHIISSENKLIELFSSTVTSNSNVISGINKIVSISNAALPDLFVTGVLMLSMSNDIVEIYNKATPTEQNAIILNGALLFTLKELPKYILSLDENSKIYFSSLLPILLVLKDHLITFTDDYLLTFVEEVPHSLPYLAPLLLPLLSDTCYNYLKETAIETAKYLYVKEQEIIQGIIDLPSNTMNFLTGKEVSYSDEL